MQKRAVFRQPLDQFVRQIRKRLPVRPKQFAPELRVERRHARRAAERAAFKPIAVKQKMLVAERKRHHMHQLAGVGDPLVVRRRVGKDHVRAAHERHQLFQQMDALLRHVRVRREDVVRAAEQIRRRVRKTAALSSRHRMTAQIDELAVFHLTHRLKKRPFHAADIRQQRARLDAPRLTAHKVCRRFRMQADDDDIHILNRRVVGVRPRRADDVSPQRFQPRRLVAVHGIALQIGIAFQRHRHAAADESQTDKHNFHNAQPLYGKGLRLRLSLKLRQEPEVPAPPAFILLSFYKVLSTIGASALILPTSCAY